MIKVSIIIPLYNVSSYLRYSIDTILNQPFKEIEIVLIDDGSTDGSSDICDEYAENDNRIKVFHEFHSGVSHSRQVGLNHATGEYLLFVDADDQVEPEMIAGMYGEAICQNADLVVCDYRELTNEGIVYRKQEPTALDGITILEDILNGKLYGALWNKMMRRKWLLVTKVSFPQELTMREDLVFLSKCLPLAKNVIYVPKAYYGYERRNASALTINYLDESLYYYNQESLWVSLIIKSPYLKYRTRQRLEQYLFSLAYATLKKGVFDKAYWNKRFKEHRDLLVYGLGFKKAIVSLAYYGHFRLAQMMCSLVSKVKL